MIYFIQNTGSRDIKIGFTDAHAFQRIMNEARKFLDQPYPQGPMVSPNTLRDLAQILDDEAKWFDRARN